MSMPSIGEIRSPGAGCPTLVRRGCGQGGSRESSTALAATRSGRSAQQPLGADVFVNFWPVGTVAASGNLPIAALFGRGVE